MQKYNEIPEPVLHIVRGFFHILRFYTIFRFYYIPTFLFRPTSHQNQNKQTASATIINP